MATRRGTHGKVRAQRGRAARATPSRFISTRRRLGRWSLARAHRLLFWAMLLLSACASTSPAPRPAPVQSPPTAAATASATEWPEIVEGRWLKLDETPDGGGNYLDPKTYVRDQGKGGSVWVRLYDKTHAYVELHEEFICRDRKLRMLQGVTYDRSGGVISTEDGPQKWQSAPPGSVAEFLLEALCAR
jgi:hypothetical protein